MKKVKSIIKRITGLIYYGFLLLKIGGPNIFFRQLKNHIYSRSNQVSLTLDLEEYEIPKIDASIKYNLKLATPQDMDEVLEKAKSETRDMAQKLLFRKWMFEDGYENCYIARTADTNEICNIACIIFPTDDEKVAGKFRSWFPRLQEDEVILEGAYTFEKFRGKRLHPSIIIDRLRICKEKGYKRVLAYIEEKNVASLKGAERTGFKQYGSAPELKLMFLTFRKYSRPLRSPETKARPVRIVDPTTDSRWDEFVTGQENSTVFHTSAWARVIKETYDYLPQYHIVENEDGSVGAAIPFYLIRSKFTGRRLVCLPFSDYCWPLGSYQEDIQVLLNATKDELNTGKCAATYLEIRGCQSKALETQSGLEGYDYFTRYILELESDPEALKRRFHLSIRRCIQQAERRDVTVRLTSREEDMERFFGLHVATRKKLGVFPQPRAFFKSIYRHVISQNKGFLGIAEYKGKTVAGVVFLTYGDTLYYKFNASDEKYLQKRPNHLIIWEALKYACAHGYKYFDFGRCTPEEEGLRTFKTRWGAKEIALPYYYYPDRTGVLNNTESGVEYRIMRYLSYVTPRWVYAAAGSLLYRHIG
jgi:CelD/BcsL family acetyltransferase involved in cellulose biosynthesis/L-amino acid N-acyltransferase YncA